MRTTESRSIPTTEIDGVVLRTVTSLTGTHLVPASTEAPHAKQDLAALEDAFLARVSHVSNIDAAVGAAAAITRILDLFPDAALTLANAQLWDSARAMLSFEIAFAWGTRGPAILHFDATVVPASGGPSVCTVLHVEVGSGADEATESAATLLEAFFNRQQEKFRLSIRAR
ncbi:hypothetical protein [Leifsonia sp. Leaf264]|uniref:hypothetical protein n=1 Tax=Leifsonia sp. Leaf264 TaxID=1736314 RepID=UPI0012F8AEF5|nr:hypothetical protein [Leifsonia sp. Leaf264]